MSVRRNRSNSRIGEIRARGLATIALALLSLAGAAGARAAGPPEPIRQLMDQLVRLEPDTRNVADVSRLILVRDACTITLESGTLALARPVQGRTVAAYFHGKGSMHVAPEQELEKDQLRRYGGAPALDREFDALVLWFADSTAEELEHRVGFHEGKFRDVKATSPDMLRGFVDANSRVVDASFLRAMLEHRRDGHFIATIAPSLTERLRFAIDPEDAEDVALTRVSDGSSPGFVISRFRSRGQPSEALESDAAPSLKIESYRLRVDLGESLRPRCDAMLEGRLGADSLRYLSFYLAAAESLVDSVRTADGRALAAWGLGGTGVLWVDLGRTYARGERLELTMRWQAEPLADASGTPTLRSGIGWYPRIDGKSRATFEIELRHPAGLLVASVGQLVRRDVVDGVVVEQWRSTVPIRNATWQVGSFVSVAAADSLGPAVRILMRGDHWRSGTGLLDRYGIASGAHMDQQVADDLAASLAFFRHVFGPIAMDTLYAFESTGVEGEAFPGLIALNWHTFQWTDSWGNDEVLRAHEVAHQWWGIGVDFASMHDRWLAEGLAQFSGLWFMQVRRHQTSLYAQALGEMRDRIVAARETGPTYLAERAATMRASEDDSTIPIYLRGAWVFHMLRNLMIDLDTMREDAFLGMMREYYTQYRGRSASTADFQKVVEAHVGQPMDWFFDQWVKRTAIPEYRWSWRTTRSGDGLYHVALHVSQRNVPDGFRMAVPVLIQLTDGSFARMRVWIDKPENDIELPAMPMTPKLVRFDDLNSVLCVEREVQ